MLIVTVSRLLVRHDLREEISTVMKTSQRVTRELIQEMPYLSYVIRKLVALSLLQSITDCPRSAPLSGRATEQS